MKLEKLVKKILTPAIISSAIFLASCGGGGGGGGKGGGKGDEVSSYLGPAIPSHVVSEGDISDYSPTSGTIYFSSPKNFNVGDIVACDINSKTPDGCLRKISSMSADKKIAYTQTETLENVARETQREIGIIINPRYLTPSNLTSSVFARGISPQSIGLHDFTAAGSASFLGGNVTATGTISFNSGFSLIVGARNNLENLSFSANFDQISSLEITALSPLNGFQQTVKIAEYNFTPFIAGYIPTPVPIPIIIKPQVEINLDFNGSVAPIQTSVTQENYITLELEYLYGQWNTNKDFSQSFAFVAPSLSETLNIEAKIVPRLNLLFYGIAGPYGEMSGNLDFNSNSQDWSLYGGLEGKVGINMDVISDNLDFFATILSLQELLASSGNGGGGGGNGSSTITDSRDGKTYKTVQIGTQLWMAENLNVGITRYQDSPMTNDGVLEKYCYNDDVSNCDIYGAWYSWDEMMQYNSSDNGTIGTTKGICSTGWHIPTHSEWMELISSLGGNNVAGGKMKETGTTHWNSPNTGATNESGFTALPGSYNGFEIGRIAVFWSATNGSAPYHTYINYDSAKTTVTNNTNRNWYSSVRCLKD